MASLLLFGATGNTGAQILEQALTAGHAVTAFVRDPAKVKATRPQVRLIQGDIGQPATVAAAFDRSYDAVISALGITVKDGTTPLTDGTRPIIAGMQQRGVKRIIVVSSVGAGDSAGIGPPWVVKVQQTVLKDTLADKTKQEQLIRESGVQWSFIRPPQLVDGPARGSILRWEGAAPINAEVAWRIARADVAAEALRALTDTWTINRAYQVSDPA
jgi:uncharacterized protein YbjT (DUF2867 family)